MTPKTMSPGAHPKQHDMAHVFAAVGVELKKARKAARISENEMAKHLRVLPEYVKAIEKGEFKAFTSVVYIIGHVRSYAIYVGIDPAPLCRRLRSSLPIAERNPEYNFVTNRFARKEFSGRLALAAVTILAIGYGGWYMVGSQNSVNPDDAVNPVVAFLDDSATGANVATPAPSVTTIGEPDATSLAERTVIADALAPRATPEPLTIIDEGPGEGLGANDIEPVAEPAATIATTTTETTPTILTPQSVTEIAEAVDAVPATLPVKRPENLALLVRPDATPDATEPEAPQNLVPQSLKPRTGQAVARHRNPANEITLKASAVSWVEITRADGSALVAWLMRPGDEYTVPGEEDFYLTTGNAGGLAIEIGGGEAKSLGEPGETIDELALDPALLSTRY